MVIFSSIHREAAYRIDPANNRKGNPLSNDDVRIKLIASIVDQAASAFYAFDPNVSIERDAKQFLTEHAAIENMTLDERERAQLFASAISVFASAAVPRQGFELYGQGSARSAFRVVDAAALLNIKLPWPFNTLAPNAQGDQPTPERPKNGSDSEPSRAQGDVGDHANDDS